jgi:hypothetical protein
MRRILSALLLVFAGAASALTPTGQDRHVSTTNTVQTLEGTFHFDEAESAPDFGPFSASVDGVMPPLDLPDLASQDSAIATGPDERLTASGFALADPDENLDEIHDTDSDSVYRVDFDIDGPRQFDLSGTLDLYAFNCEASTLGHARLTGPGGVIFEVQDEIITGYATLLYCEPACEVSLPVEAGGLLAPGSYSFEVAVESYGQGLVSPGDVCDTPYSRADYDVALSLLDPRVPALPASALALAGLAMAASPWVATGRRRRPPR